VLRLSRKDVLSQPLLQIEIIGKTTKQHHRHVCMSVDQTRRDDFSSRDHSLPRRVARFNLRARANGDDATLRDSNSTILDHTTRPVHRHDRATEYEQINCLAASLSGSIWKGGHYDQ